MSSVTESKAGNVLLGKIETNEEYLERFAWEGYSVFTYQQFFYHYEFFELLRDLESILGGDIPTVQ